VIKSVARLLICLRLSENLFEILLRGPILKLRRHAYALYASAPRLKLGPLTTYLEQVLRDFEPLATIAS
jgi:hypothetical protein